MKWSILIFKKFFASKKTLRASLLLKNKKTLTLSLCFSASPRLKKPPRIEKPSTYKNHFIHFAS